MALVPAALRAIGSLAANGILPANYSNASTYADVWEQQAYTFFQVPVTPTAAEASLQKYVQQANLSTSLLSGAGSLNSSQSASKNGSSGYGAMGQYVGGDAGNSTFFALSINANGSLVEVSKR